MNINSRNYGQAIGHLGRKPVTITNRDGSTTYLMSIACRRNYKNAEGQRDVDWIDLKGFVPAGKKAGVYPLLDKGTKVQVMYTIVSSTYTDHNGNTKHGMELRITGIELLDAAGQGTRTSTDTAQGAAAAAPVVPSMTANEGPFEEIANDDAEFDA